MLNILENCEYCIYNDKCKQYNILNELYSFLAKIEYDGVYLDAYLRAHNIGLVDLNCCAYCSKFIQRSQATKYFETRIL